jgi:glycosyltransferase involved in cell wall biosynthesis
VTEGRSLSVYGRILFKFFVSRDIEEIYKRIYNNTLFDVYCRSLKELVDKPLVSFIVPTRNEANYISRLLRSLNYLRRVCDVPIEIIVADYESTDGTTNISKRFGAEVIELDKPGIGYASYIATTYAKGDIIIRTDADVIITPSSMYYVLNTMRKKDKLVATVGHIYYPFKLENNVVAFVYDKYMRKPYNTTGYFIAFKKKLTNYVNFSPSLRYNEDWDFGYRVYRLFGERAMDYNYLVAVLVSSRLIDKQGFARYIIRRLLKTPTVTYTQLKEA